MFWECIVDHYSKHKLVGGRENFDSKVVEPNNKGNDHEFLHQLQGARAIKEDQKSTKLKKCVLHAQVQATTYILKLLKKALEDQSTLQLFTMFEKLIMTP
jgi:hypothetical protein